MTEDPCKSEMEEFIEALLRLGEAQQRAGSFLPIVTEPLNPIKDIEPVILTEEMLEQWRVAKRQEGEASDSFDAKADALVECRKAQQSNS